MGSHPLAFLRLPFGLLAALDSRMLHFWMQPMHFAIRMLHILSMALFFGMVLVIDLGLVRRFEAIRMRVLADIAVPWLHANFAITFATGLALFFYDPVGVGSRAYFVPKLILIMLAMASATYGHRVRYPAILRGDAISARGIAVTSILLWTGVIVCSCLNSEAIPKVFLRW